MSIDQRGDRAAGHLHDEVVSALPAPQMLESLRRTRTRRRVSLSTALAAVVVGAVIVATTTPHRDEGGPVEPGPTSPTSVSPPQARANGAVFGFGTDKLLHPAGLEVPSLGSSSTPTWSADGSQVAVLAGGILITDVHSGRTDRLPCPGCTEIAWSPDGRSIAAATTQGGRSPLLLVDVGTSRRRAVALPRIHQVSSLTWAPDSKHLAFLALQPAPQRGAWTVALDGSRPSRFLAHATGLLGTDQSDAVILDLDWSPTRGEVAVLYATYDTASASYGLDVWTVRPDGSSPMHVVGDGACACGGWAPDLVWSPDGRILLVSSLVRRPDRTRLDSDGTPIDVRFAAGASGRLSWQPLPR